MANFSWRLKRIGERKRASGFTLVEFLIAFVVLVVLSGVAVWQIQTTLPGYRAVGASAEFLGAIRSASAIAARTNRPIQIVVTIGGSDGCANGYTVESMDGIVYDSTCMDSDYRGVSFPDDKGNVQCKDEEARGEPELPACSLCGGGSIVFLPTGEVLTFAAAGDTLVFAPADGAPQNTRAIGIRPGPGRSRSYRLQGEEWICP